MDKKLDKYGMPCFYSGLDQEKYMDVEDALWSVLEPFVRELNPDVVSTDEEGEEYLEYSIREKMTEVISKSISHVLLEYRPDMFDGHSEINIDNITDVDEACKIMKDLKERTSGINNTVSQLFEKVIYPYIKDNKEHMEEILNKMPPSYSSFRIRDMLLQLEENKEK